MKWRQLDQKCFESETRKGYFHLRKEGGVWILDLFENNNTLKYIDSFEFSDIDSAKYDAENYILK